MRAVSFCAQFCYTFSMTTLQRIREVLKDNEEYLRGFGFTEVGVFGSYVRGQETPESDVDILLGGDNGRIDIRGESLDIQEKLSAELDNADVDIVTKYELYPQLRDGILAEVEYVIGSAEAMRHNEQRDMNAIRSNQRDYTIYLGRMIDAMRAGMACVADISYEEFLHNTLSMDIAKSYAQKMGRAATRISAPLKEHYGYLSIPWDEMTDMHDIVVAHLYGDVDYTRMWRLLKQTVPAILPKIQEMNRKEKARMREIRERKQKTPGPEPIRSE